jgi:hypothetical protein
MQPSNTLRQPSRSAGLAIFLITVGTLSAIWAAVWYFFLKSRDNPPHDWAYFVCAGTFFSGVALVVIGGLVGFIGRQARQADNPVGQVTAAAVTPNGAAAPAVVPQGGAPVVTATGPAAQASVPHVVVPQQVHQA